MTTTLNLLDPAQAGANWSYGLGIDQTHTDSPNEGNPSELEYYDPAQVSLGSAGAVFTAKTCTPHLCGDGKTRFVVSGAANTHNKRAWQPTAGKPVTITARVKLPSGAGAWPAIWLLPASGVWTNEIDVLEYVRAAFNLHHNTPPATAWQIGPIDYGMTDPTNFHGYKVVWTTDHLEFSVDGRVVKTITDVTKIPAEPMYLIVNLAVVSTVGLPASLTLASLTVSQ